MALGGESRVIGTRVEDGVAIVSINRAEKANALPEVGKRTLANEIGNMAGRENVQAIVLTGQGNRSFCAGSDIAEMQSFAQDDMYRMLGAERDMYLAALSCPKPVVAAVNGFALGAGLILVMSCDYAVAAVTARFGTPELTIGVAAPLEGFLLPWIVGLGHARRLFYTGRQLDAAEAERAGLVHEVIEAESCLQRAVEAAREMAALPGTGFRIQKALLYQLVTTGHLDSVIEASRHATSLQFADTATTEAMSTFLARQQ
jgi:enoyl-CoA hydratase/carnithine racemase